MDPKTNDSTGRFDPGFDDAIRRSRRRPRRAPARPRPVPRPSKRPSKIDRFARWLGAALARTGRALYRWFRSCSRQTQVRVACAVLAVTVVAPIMLLNLAVAFFGQTVVFPLSPFFLREKVAALISYATHRPLCALVGHPETDVLVAQAEVRQKLPRGLLAAVIQTESGGKPHRISPTGAMGPGQLMPGTARMLGVSDPFDSEANIDGAARLLADHLGRYRGNIRLAVAAYNAGPGAVRGRVPDNGETPAYVARVMDTYRELRPRPRRVRRL
jgi:soluble lytic murein transglycosylase-like protein